jgi:hypothetical protein
MIAIVCIDNKGGMLFNDRRQSQDRVLRKRILSRAAGEELWMNAYSAKQFLADGSVDIRVDEAFLQNAPESALCFVETEPLAPVLARLEGLILCKWNRAYPADVFLDVQPESAGMHLVDSAEFPGSSHEKITMEEYRR